MEGGQLRYSGSRYKFSYGKQGRYLIASPVFRFLEGKG